AGEAHDERLTGAAAPSGLIRCGGPPGRKNPSAQSPLDDERRQEAVRGGAGGEDQAAVGDGPVVHATVHEDVEQYANDEREGEAEDSPYPARPRVSPLRRRRGGPMAYGDAQGDPVQKPEDAGQEGEHRGHREHGLRPAV